MAVLGALRGYMGKCTGMACSVAFRRATVARTTAWRHSVPWLLRVAAWVGETPAHAWRCSNCYRAGGIYRHKETPTALHHGRLFHLLSCHLRNASSAMARYMCASAIVASTASGKAINKSRATVTICTTTRQNSSSIIVPARNMGAMPVTSRDMIAATARSLNVFIACSNVKARGRCRAPLVC